VPISYGYTYLPQLYHLSYTVLHPERPELAEEEALSVQCSCIQYTFYNVLVIKMTIKEKLHKAVSKIKIKRNKVRDTVGKAVKSDKLKQKITSQPPKKHIESMKSISKYNKSTKNLKIMPE
jgi:hypothetical protein